jgi:hypothetical protein
MNCFHCENAGVGTWNGIDYANADSNQVLPVTPRARPLDEFSFGWVSDLAAWKNYFEAKEKRAWAMCPFSLP